MRVAFVSSTIMFAISNSSSNLTVHKFAFVVSCKADDRMKKEAPQLVAPPKKSLY